MSVFMINFNWNDKVRSCGDIFGLQHSDQAKSCLKTCRAELKYARNVLKRIKSTIHLIQNKRVVVMMMMMIIFWTFVQWTEFFGFPRNSPE